MKYIKWNFSLRNNEWFLKEVFNPIQKTNLTQTPNPTRQNQYKIAVFFVAYLPELLNDPNNLDNRSKQFENTTQTSFDERGF